jgi:hypothetical protein
MRSRKNPYTKSAVDFQKSVPAQRSEYLDSPLRGVAFTEQGFEKLVSDGSDLIGIVFRSGTRIVEYLANIANTAILIESVLLKSETPRDLLRMEVTFDPRQDIGIEVVQINKRAFTISTRSPTAFATRAMCLATASEALFAILGKLADPLLLYRLAEPLRFDDLSPEELKFTWVGGDTSELVDVAVARAERTVAAVNNILLKSLSDVVPRAEIDPVLFTALPAKINMDPFRAAFARFLVTAIGDTVGMAQDWRQGLWSSLDLHADGRVHVRLTRFTENFSAWGEGLFIQSATARKQIGAFAALIGCIYSSLDTADGFKTGGAVRVSLSRQPPTADSAPTISAEVVGPLLELRFDGDARDALMSPAEITTTLLNLLSTLPTVASRVNSSAVTALVSEWAKAGLLQTLSGEEFGPALIESEPTIPAALAKSEYIRAFAQAVQVANSGIQVYIDTQTAVRDARELHKFPTQPNPFAPKTFTGVDVYSGISDMLLHPEAGCLILPDATRSDIRPLTQRVIYQLAESMATLGDIASRAYQRQSATRVCVTVALRVRLDGREENAFDMSLKVPEETTDKGIRWSDEHSERTLTPDQMAAIGIYPTLELEFNSPQALYSRMFKPDKFEATARALYRILGPKVTDKTSVPPPSFSVAAGSLHIEQSRADAGRGGTLRGAVYAYQQEFERILLQAVAQGETLHEEAIEDAQRKATALHKFISNCILALINLGGARDRVVFSAAPRAPDRGAIDALWTASCMTELALSEMRQMLDRMSQNETLKRLAQMLELQERALVSRIEALNREIVQPSTSDRALVATEEERQSAVARLENTRRLKRDFEQLASYVQALAKGLPEIPQSDVEVAAGEEAFKELSAPPAPQIVVPPSTQPDSLLPPSDPPSSQAEPLAPPPVEYAAYKSFTMDSLARVTDVAEEPANGDPLVAAVDCIALGELRWLVRHLRGRAAKAQQELEIDASATYRFAYSTEPQIGYLDTEDPTGAHTVTIYIPAQMDISGPVIYEQVALTLAECMAELGAARSFEDDEDEPDVYDIYDELVKV